MGFSVSTIKSLDYNRSQRRHRSKMKTTSKERLILLEEMDSYKKNTEENPLKSSKKPIPFIVRLWNFLK